MVYMIALKQGKYYIRKTWMHRIPTQAVQNVFSEQITSDHRLEKGFLSLYLHTTDRDKAYYFANNVLYVEQYCQCYIDMLKNKK